MIQSMTGYAERSFASRTLQAKFSLKSLNHRFFDWSYKGPPLGHAEKALRDLCQGCVRRGRIEVALELDALDPASWEITINEPLLRKMILALRRASGPNSQVRFSVENILRLPQVVELRRKDFSRAERVLLEQGFARALEDLVADRRREGRNLAHALREQVTAIKAALHRLGGLYKKQPRQFRERIVQRLKESRNGNALSESRLTEEAALQAQKYDITEEMARLRSHLASVLELLSPQREEPVGKMLDFLAQELTREANTINAKSQDLAITRESLLIKAAVENIRQQVQNLE